VICPACTYSNLEGADVCESCGHDLAEGTPSTELTPVADSLALTPLRKVEAPAAIMVPPTATLVEVVDRLVAGNVGCVLVVAKDRLVGIFSERDLLMKAAHRYEELKNCPVRDFMTADPETLGPDATVAWALNRMDVGGFRHIPIVENDRPIGLLSVKDLVRHLGATFLAQSA